MRPLFKIAAICLLFVFSACSPSPSGTKESKNPAPSSSMTLATATNIAAGWWQQDPGNRAFSVPTPTASMLPYLDSKTVLLLERVKPETKVHVNDIVVFDRGDAPNVCHRVLIVRGRDYFISGDNNSRSDGWFAHEKLSYRVAGTIFTLRD